MKLLLVGNGAWAQSYKNTLSKMKVSFQVATRSDWKQLIDELPDGVIVCTPPDSHIEIASYALNKNIPTMIEKPLSLSLEDANKLKVFTAPILINHIRLFSEQHQSIKNSIVSENIKRIVSVNTNNTPPRSYSQLWDYGPHDISMILDLSNKFPKLIECKKNPFDDGNFSIGMMFDNFETNTIVGHSDFTKVRWLEISDHRTFKYEDNKNEQPLTNSIGVFIDAINGKTDYRLGIDLSLNVIKILEYCQLSLDINSPVECHDA